MSDTVLRLSSVSKSYNLGKPTQLDVLVDVDLDVKEGEIIGLIAPSGAGKSTLLHIAGLLDTPDAGAVLVEGEDMGHASDALRTATRRNILGFVYQFHHLLPEFSALENITLPMRASGLSAAEAADRSSQLLRTVGLADRGHHRPAELSGGEQQRVALCRALANAPRVLLADEPTGNLDPKTSDAVFETLLFLVRETGLSAIIATHNLALAAKMDRRVRLKNGRLDET
ncbi:MAG: ABC transporter ATP-binding protein [Pseudomonadota bacterium]